ncbi:MAG: pyruvate carboxylase subunit B [Kiritimatiellae bacterium]|nr:pyruvate carboxylase subunit B [Kiritimatiellia bacterium]
MPRILVTDTTLRDAHQSLWATRMRTADILPALEAIDAAGYYSLECWGGATFDVCMRFLREDPWERLRAIRSRCKTPLQMLLRGQNILGYRHYPDDVVRRFVELAAKNGIAVFRVFDALNDVRNLEVAVKAVKATGMHAQGTISYTTSPIHNDALYVSLARDLEALGADSICVKDMAGILSPAEAARLSAAITGAVSIPLQIHSHMTSGMAVASYLAAAKAGAGALDTCVSSMSGISSQPPVETVMAVLGAEGMDTGLDLEAVAAAARHFKALRPKREPSSASREYVDAGVLRHHIPGGMISNLRSQLQEQGALDRLDEVLAELPRVRAEMGYPPLVTPTSQIVGVQAVLNVLGGKRYGHVTEETRNYVRGLYGRAPGKIDPKVAKLALGGARRMTRRPADLLKPGLPAAAAALPAKFQRSEEDILSYAIFPEVALGYFEWRDTPADRRPPIPADVEEAARAAAPAQVRQDAATKPDQAKAAPDNAVLSPFAGTFHRRPAPDKAPWVGDGAGCAKGAVVCAIEAMKLFNNVEAPRDCKSIRFLVEDGAAVSKGTPLFAFE